MTDIERVEPNYIEVTSRGRIEKIHLLHAGPKRTISTAAVIFVSGVGTPCLGFATVMRQLAKAGITSYAYDRSGLGRSPGRLKMQQNLGGDPEPARMPARDLTSASPEEKRTAIDMADDLSALLGEAEIRPPYVLVLHSYGGIIGREYIAKHNEDVVGAIFIDANCQNAADRQLNFEDVDKLVSCEGLDFWTDSGLEIQQQLDTAEWEELTQGRDPPAGFERGYGGGILEIADYYSSVRGLQRLQQYEKHVLGRRPVSVVKGTVEPVLERLLALADKNHAGSEDLRSRVRSRMMGLNENEKNLQRAQLQLAEDGCGRMVDVPDAGHFVHMSHPQVVSKEIEWVVEQAGKRGFLKEEYAPKT